jgi:hypothetical protein
MQAEKACFEAASGYAVEWHEYPMQHEMCGDEGASRVHSERLGDQYGDRRRHAD